MDTVTEHYPEAHRAGSTSPGARRSSRSRKAQGRIRWAAGSPPRRPPPGPTARQPLRSPGSHPVGAAEGTDWLLTGAGFWRRFWPKLGFVLAPGRRRPDFLSRGLYGVGAGDSGSHEVGGAWGAAVCTHCHGRGPAGKWALVHPLCLCSGWGCRGHAGLGQRATFHAGSPWASLADLWCGEEERAPPGTMPVSSCPAREQDGAVGSPTEDRWEGSFGCGAGSAGGRLFPRGRLLLSLDLKMCVCSS